MGFVVALGRAIPAPDLEGLRTALGQAAGGVVAPGDIRWEPSHGALVDAIFGRGVFFLSSATPTDPKDVHRAVVRVAPEGAPIYVQNTHNLTGTPLGDDHALVVSGGRVAFATSAFGQELSVTVLELESELGETSGTRVERVMHAISNWQQTGAYGGLARTDLIFDEPARAIGLALTPTALRVDTVVATARRAFEYRWGAADAPAPGVHPQPLRHAPKRFIHWAVDTVRAVPWIGPEPIAWLEERVFGVRDQFRQWAFRARSGSQEVMKEPTELTAAVLHTSLGGDEASWPPPRIPSPWPTPERGEGIWEEPRMPWLLRMPSAPSPFYRTFVRTDAERPYVKVLLVAMDTRQLDLDMEAGAEDPKPLTGATGTGRIPRDRAVFTRVAATFNGAFKTEHGNYGMMVRRRVLLPPQPAAASVIVLRDRRVAMGTWGARRDFSGLGPIDEPDIWSFRQNLDPLVDNDKVNPSGRALWGYTLPGTGMQTERSGICITPGGHLLYAWGDDVSGTVLAKAMKLAGCNYGMHLDMNPHHTGFVFTKIEDIKSRAYKAELLSPDMEISPDKYIEFAPKDFFYVLLRDPAPPHLGPAKWEPSSGVLPPPAWLPAIWQTTSHDVALVSLDADRIAFRIRAGTREPDPKTGMTPARQLEGDDASHVLGALTLGVAHEKKSLGLATAGRVVLPIEVTEHDAVLVAEPGRALSILRHAEWASLPPHADGAVLPLLFDGETTFAVEGRARAALGTTPEGRVVIARAHGKAEAMADELRKAGCVRAVVLDRGERATGTLHRAGTDSAPRAFYEESVLYWLSAPGKPRAFRFEASVPATNKAR